MRIQLVNNKTDDLQLLINFCKHKNHSYKLVEPAEIANEKDAEYDLIILSGGLWYDDPTQQQAHYEEELKLITKSEVPILGICLGMQLITAAFDGELMELKREQHGLKHINLTDTGKRLLKWPDDVNVYENHTVGVTKCPSQFEVLATSKDCIEAIKHVNRPIVGVQFHPEKLHKKEHAGEVWGSLLGLLGVE